MKLLMYLHLHEFLVAFPFCFLSVLRTKQKHVYVQTLISIKMPHIYCSHRHIIQYENRL